MRVALESKLPGESVLTFGMARGVGFITLSAQHLSDREIQQVVAHIATLSRKTNGSLALDIQLVRPFNCAWINALIELDASCRELGGSLVLASVPDEAFDILRATGLDRKLAIAANRAEALSMLEPAGASQGLLGWLKHWATRKPAAA